MTEQTRQSAPTFQTVVGWIDMFDAVKGFGFIEAVGATDPATGRSIRAYFRHETARVVHYQADGSFKITNQRDTTTEPRASKPNVQFVIAQVHKTAKGWRTARWGFRPGANWFYSYRLASSDLFDPFIGGKVTIDTGWGEHTEHGTVRHIACDPLLLQLTLDGDDNDDHRSFKLTGSTQGFTPDGKLWTRSSRLGWKLVFERPGHKDEDA